MCGIAGIFGFAGAPVADGEIRAMLGVLGHRGPDDTGIRCARGVGLGHNRLAVIDTAGSTQPMSSPDGRLHLTFNGEILNYARLRAELDHPFRTHGDTETLLAVLLRHGLAGVERLRGQFAFAVHDAERDELHLVRDRMGILPLYWAVEDGRLHFASEIKALLAVLRRRAVDRESLHDYLGHRSVHAPFTLFEGIRQLPPGHRLSVDRNGQVDVRAWWSFPVGAAASGPVDHADAVDRVEAALVSSVEEALVADVPVGAYLSGGLDSSLVTALASRARPGAPLHTYSAGFRGATDDDRPWARQVSRLLGTRHKEVLVGPEDYLELWDTLSWHRDMPLSEPANVATYRLATLAREDVTVVLSGEGCDELFAGYPKYRMARLAELAGLAPAAVRGPALAALARALPPRFARQAIALRALSAARAGERRSTWFASFTPAERERLLGAPRRGISPWYDAVGGDALQRMLQADCRGWLPDNLLHGGDRMSMAASLEMRPPFLDHRLVELAFTLPSSVKIHAGVTKWVVKEVGRRYLPDAVIDRRKVGFAVPLDRWFRGELLDTAWDVLTSPSSLTAQLMPVDTVRALLRRHAGGRHNEHVRLWTLMSLERWHDVFFRSPGPIAAPCRAAVSVPLPREQSA